MIVRVINARVSIDFSLTKFTHVCISFFAKLFRLYTRSTVSSRYFYPSIDRRNYPSMSDHYNIIQ